MCIVKKPKAVAVTADSDKDAPVLRNPYLDGIDPVIRSRMTGLKSLRVDASSTAPRQSNPSLVVPTSPSSTSTISDAQRAALGLVAGNKFAASL